ncbi:MAG: DNA primase [Tannerellaceae bacterium]|nr:DNA primase [Tannerellaceae bacterium]
MIDRTTIDKILDASNIVDVVAEFVSLRRRGVNFVGLCPFHADKSPSFYVSPAKNICKCFSCGEGGTAVHFIMKHEQLSYSEALRYLAKKYNIDVKDKEESEAEKIARGDRESMMIINSWAEKYFVSVLHESPEGQSIGMRYCRERGFRDDIIRKFRIGYSPEERDALVKEASRLGYRKEFLEKTGLIVTYENGSSVDRFRGRLIFPIHTISGKVIAFGGRILKKDDKTAKYVNSPESEIYHKSNELYGIFFAKQSIVREKRCFLVEGYTDVIAMHQAGIENVLASAGTALTQGQIRLIHRFTNNITVLYDGDEAGIRAALRGIDLILEEGLNVKVVLLPDGDDPDSFARKQSASKFVAYINENEVDFIRFKVQLMLGDAGNDPIKRATAIADIVRTVAIIPDNISRALYIKECSVMMEVSEQMLNHEVNKKLIDKREKQYAQALREKESVDTNPTDVESSAIEVKAAAEPSKSPVEAYELVLLKYIVRYGERIIDENVDAETGEYSNTLVAEYIAKSLEEDDMLFRTPIYKLMLDEAAEHVRDAGFQAVKYFLAHPDGAISRLAADLASDKYLLSKYHSRTTQIKQEEERLDQLIPYDIFSFKDACIRHDIDAIDERLKQIQNTGSNDEIMALLAEKAALNNIKKSLNKLIGERIILKM